MVVMFLLLLQLKGYAAVAIRTEIDELQVQKVQISRQSEEFKVSFAETLGFIDAAIEEVTDAKASLSSRDDADAIAVLDSRLKELGDERQALLDRFDDLSPRDLAAEIAEIDRRIASLQASLAKLPNATIR